MTAPPPTALTAGQAFGMTVSAEDDSGTVDSTFNGPATVAGLSNFNGASTVTAVKGVATFSSLKLDIAGTARLRVDTSDGSLRSPTLAPIAVHAGAATQLVFMGDTPLTVAGGASFDLQAEAVDPYDNVDLTFNQNVAVSITSGPKGASLGGTVSTAAVDGVATFNGMSLDSASGFVFLQAAAGGLASAQWMIDVMPVSGGGSSGGVPPTTGTPNAAPRLVITSQPSAVDAGRYFTLTMVAERADGIVDSGYNGTVTLSLAGNPRGATLGGNPSMPMRYGMMTFYGLTLDVPGPGYTIRATSNGYAAATSAPITVDDPPVQLMVTVQPLSNLSVNQGFGLTVAVVDIFGDLASGYDGPVSLSLAGKHGRARLHGTLTVDAIDGIATFSRLTLTGASRGSSLRIQAGADGLTATTTAPVLDPPARTNRPSLRRDPSTGLIHRAPLVHSSASRTSSPVG